MARTVDDVLARRTRAQFLDFEATRSAAGDVTRILARELGRDAAWQADQLGTFERIIAADLTSIGSSSESAAR